VDSKKIVNYGLTVIKKNLSFENQNFTVDSKKIRMRYNRIREDSFRDVKSGIAKLDKPIFIVGVPHSGTSVLASTFKMHPDIAMWTEASEVWEPYWAEGIDSEFNRLVPEDEDYVEPMDVFRITDAFYRYVKSQNKKRLMNKNPRNTVRIKILKKIFPDAKIIHIFRDGRDVVSSITKNMPARMIEDVCERWKNTIYEVKKQSTNLSQSEFFEFSYEDFCENPKSLILKSYEICELEINDRIKNRIPLKFSNFNGRWKQQIDKKHQKVMEEKLSVTLSELGYN